MTVAAFTHPLDARVEAELARIRLESEGIAARLGDAAAFNVVSEAIAFGGVKVLVPAADVERAMRVLAENPPTARPLREQNLPRRAQVYLTRAEIIGWVAWLAWAVATRSEGAVPGLIITGAVGLVVAIALRRRQRAAK